MIELHTPLYGSHFNISEWSRNTILVMSTQVHHLSHRTVQYGAHSFADSGESGSTSRVAHCFGSGKLYICLSNKCFKVYPAYLLCDKRKTLTGSPDPTYMQPADKPCIIGGESSL